MENIITDILNQLITEALEIKETAKYDFENGKLFGYYESISTILNQTEAFGFLEKLPIELQKFNPESLLTNINNSNI